MEGQYEKSLAERCAETFAKVTGAGCVVTDVDGALLLEKGHGCASCAVCSAAGRPRDACTRAYRQGLTEATRFGGKYVYLCPMGLGLFATPIVVIEESVMGITVGPFLMVEAEDYLAFDAERLAPGKADALRQALARVPEIEPGQVQPLCELLFLSASGIGDAAGVKRLLDEQESGERQGDISSYLSEIKRSGAPEAYPIEIERALLSSIAGREIAATNDLLNRLLGHILFVSGGSLAALRAHIYTLLALTSRAAIDGGADSGRILSLHSWYALQLEQIQDVDKLCYWLGAALGRYVSGLFAYKSGEHLDVMPAAIEYIHRNFARKLTLEEVAAHAYLSPAHFSRLFAREMGVPFSRYLQGVRIERSKRLLRENAHSLTEIASMAGFSDQSYFSRVFRRATGMSPKAYRRSLSGR